MFELNQSIQRVSPSPTLALTAKAKELKAQGEDVIAFTAGEPDFDTPDHIKDAAKEALDNGFTKYTPVGGIPELKKALVEKFKRDQKWDVTPEQILIGNGGKQVIAEAFGVLLNPGDEVVIPAPYWTSYPDMVKLAGGEPVVVETSVENRYLITAEELKASITDKTKAVIINSPSNPTGACYTAEHLKELADVITSLPNGKDILVMSDEVYEFITFDGFKHVSIVEAAPEIAPQTLIVDAFSKSYSMTGWRVGFAAGPKEIIAAMTKCQSQTTSNVCSIAQYAAARAFDDNGAFPSKLQDEFWKRIQIVKEEVDKIPGLELPFLPEGAFYAFLRVDGLIGKKNGAVEINGASDFAAYLLDNYRVVIVPGEAFGDAGGFRISIAVSEEQLRKGLSRIADAVSELS